MEQPALDLSRVFELDEHGIDSYVGQTPPYPWGRIYGGLVVAQALWAATQTVREEHRLHSLHAYFILGGDLDEPVRYEVDRVRNGRSFTTRRVLARQSAGAILTLGCSFQVAEEGPASQSAVFPSDVALPDASRAVRDAGLERVDVVVGRDHPRSALWTRYPETLGEDPRLHACALAYLSDLNPMSAIIAAHPSGIAEEEAWAGGMSAASLDHSMWFHRPVRCDDWVLFDLAGHGLVGSRGLATGPVFAADGVHVATVAQEGLLREARDGSA